MAAALTVLVAHSSQPVARPTISLSEVVAKLDMLSFRNAVHQREPLGGHTLADAGFTIVDIKDERASVTPVDRGWSIDISVLGQVKGGAAICFTDQAVGGGTYLTQKALVVKWAKSGLLVAVLAPRGQWTSCKDYQ